MGNKYTTPINYRNGNFVVIRLKRVIRQKDNRPWDYYEMMENDLIEYESIPWNFNDNRQELEKQLDHGYKGIMTYKQFCTYMPTKLVVSIKSINSFRPIYISIQFNIVPQKNKLLTKIGVINIEKLKPANTLALFQGDHTKYTWETYGWTEYTMANQDRRPHRFLLTMFEIPKIKVQNYIDIVNLDKIQPLPYFQWSLRMDIKRYESLYKNTKKEIYYNPHKKRYYNANPDFFLF